jgi:hypothetical protein
LASIDVAITTGGPEATAAIEVGAAVGGVSQSAVAAALAVDPSVAVVTRRSRPGEVVSVRFRDRTTPHLRHAHKYDRLGVGGAARFFFWDPPGAARRAVAANLDELGVELAGCAASTVAHHASRHDFSRWIADVLLDQRLAAAVAQVEGSTQATDGPERVEPLRLALLMLLEARRDRTRRS